MNGASAMPPRSSAAPLAGFRAAGRVVLIAALLAGLVAVALNWHALSAASLQAALARYPAAPAAFLAVHVAASLLFIPRTMLAVAAGLMFGLWSGILWAAAGSVLGAVAGFWVARYVNGGLVDLEASPRIGPALLRAESGGWRAVAILRLVPVLPHSLANYALGLTRLPVGAYALGSLLGQLPMTVASVEFGAAGGSALAGKAGWVEPTLIGAAALAVSFLLPRIVGRRG
jgi:uncharacterized membrane protein YdjX (TVP38/TMEM64 family)